MPLDFGEKLGPLPVWGWGVLGGGVVIVGYFLFNRGGNDADGNVSYLDANGYQTSGITGGSASIDETPAAYDNNTLWLTRASRDVAAKLTRSPSEVYSALKKWLYGESLTTGEKEAVDTAIGMFGTPPEGTQGNSPVTKPETVEKPVNVRTIAHDTTREAKLYRTATTSGSFRSVPKGTRLYVVPGASTPTRYKILLQDGTYAYIGRVSVRRV